CGRRGTRARANSRARGVGARRHERCRDRPLDTCGGGFGAAWRRRGAVARWPRRHSSSTRRPCRKAVSDRKARVVILAAGTSSRVGRQKLLMDFRGRALIEYAIAAAQRWNPIAVVGADVAEYLDGRDDVTLVRNDSPARGM